MNKPIYLDYQSTTPVDKKVFEVMKPYFYEEFGNPHSKTHTWGHRSEDALEDAREKVAQGIGASAKDIIFTSGATESNNLALKGVMNFYKQQNKNHLIVANTEHKCVLSTAHYLKRQGFEVTYLAVKNNGLIDLQELEKNIKETTALVSIMAVNNEIGVVQPVKEIGEICKKHDVFFHTDAAQAIGKIPFNVDDLNVDLVSISGHKVYGPKGIGALYVSRKKPRVRLEPQIHGGGQERGLRSGTMPTALCVGLGEAVKLAVDHLDENLKHVQMLSDKMYNILSSQLTRIYLNGDKDSRVPHNLNISFAGVEGESLLLRIGEVVAISSGSACTSGSLEGSYVLRSLGVADELAHTSLRIGLSHENTEEEIELIANTIVEAVQHLRKMSPIWDMLEQGIDLSKVEWDSDH